MTATDAAEVLSVLRAIGPEDPAELVGSGWRDTYAGNVTWTFRGWTIVVFNDCMDWDYLDSVTAPDGRTWDFDEMTDEVAYWEPEMDDRRRYWTDASIAAWPTLTSWHADQMPRGQPPTPTD